MKELRIQFSGLPIRAFYVFDPILRAIVLCAGDKSNDKRLYEKLICIAEDQFAARSPESQARIKEMSDEMILEVGLQMIREELQLSQKYLAEMMRISQLGQRGNDLKLTTLKCIVFHI